MENKYAITYDDLKYQAVSLPEDIMKMKWAGRLDTARAMIENRLTLPNLPHAYRARLILELKNLRHLEVRYVLTKDEVLSQIQARIPDFTMEEVDQLIIEGRLEWIFINGEERFLTSTVRNLFNQFADMQARDVTRKSGDRIEADECTDFDRALADLEDGQEIHGHIHMRHELFLEENAILPGKTLRVHLPLPVERQQIHSLKIHSITPQPAHMPDTTDGMPTVYFEVPAEKGQIFSAEYQFENILRYHDLTKVDPDAVWKDFIENGYPEDTHPYLREHAPNIVFTPYLQALAAELKGNESNPLRIARAMYDYITCNLTYTFVRDYASIDVIADHMAVNRKGDCGMQALLFITLCRIAGVPARWQSGLAAEPGDIGEHDWAQFYLPSVGWVFVDPSFGMSAKRKNEEARWNFYFGNLDPFRVPFNCDVQCEFNPPRQFLRYDTVDSQDGEAEYADAPVFSEVHRRFTDLGIHLVKPEPAPKAAPTPVSAPAGNSDGKEQA